MCGRFTLTTDPGIVGRRFGAPPTQGGGATPRYNVAPTQLVVTVTDDGARHFEQMQWGLIPSWAKDASGASKLINARAETLTEKPSFRTALRRRRCLIPADGFYEWAALPGAKGKQPVRVRLRSGEPFAFAGLWDEWAAPTGERVRTCTIITTTPNEMMATLHHRMPVILRSEAESVWLDPKISDPAVLLLLLTPYPAAEMEWFPVSSLVNSAAVDSPECAAPLAGTPMADAPSPEPAGQLPLPMAKR